MTKRDLVLVVGGSVAGSGGVVCSLFGYTNLALVALLLLGIVLLILTTLQRRQLGRLQERTLKILRQETKISPGSELEDSSLSEDQAEVAIYSSTKKILGMLQAQQNEIHSLSEEIEKVLAHESPTRNSE